MNSISPSRAAGILSIVPIVIVSVPERNLYSKSHLWEQLVYAFCGKPVDDKIEMVHSFSL